LEIEKLKKRLEESKRNKDICENDIVRLEESARRMDEMLKEIKELDSLNTELQNSRELFSELSEISIKTDNQLSEIRNKISELDRLIKDNLEKKQRLEFLYSQQKDYESKKSRFDDLIKHRKGLEVKIDELEVKLSGKNINEMEDELKKLIAYEKEIETKVKSSDELIKEKELRISEYEYKMNEFNKNKREIERLDELIKNLKIFGQALKETQIQLRKEFVGAVNYAMQDLWLTLYPYKDFIDIRLSVETGDYVLQLKEGSGRWVNVEGIASGGERSIAALALRIAFALVLAPQLKWLVLDEPTANLDSKAIRDFAETLKYKINDFMDQVFIITHNPEIEYAVTGSLYRLEREKEKDGCTKVLRVS